MTTTTPFTVPSAAANAPLPAFLSDDDFMADAAGVLLWYSVSRCEPTIGDIAYAMTASGVSPSYTPRAIEDLDAWKRASGALKVEYKLPGERTGKLMVRDVSTEPELVTRHIVREIVDAKGHHLDYTTVGCIEFHRPGAKAGGTSGTASVEINQNFILSGDSDLVHVEKFADKIRDRYPFCQTHYSSLAMTTILRQMVLDLKAIRVRESGGVYFIHRSHLDTVKAIKEFVKALPGTSDVCSIPLVDTTEQRTMLSNAFAEEVSSEVEDLLKDIAKLNEKYGDDPVPARTYDNLADRLAQATIRAEEHKATLDIVSARSETALLMAAQSVSAVGLTVKRSARQKKKAAKEMSE